MLRFGYKINIGGQAFMKKYHFSTFNINAGSVTLLVMISCFSILSLILSMAWEIYAIDQKHILIASTLSNVMQN